MEAVGRGWVREAHGSWGELLLECFVQGAGFGGEEGPGLGVAVEKEDAQRRGRRRSCGGGGHFLLMYPGNYWDMYEGTWRAEDGFTATCDNSIAQQLRKLNKTEAAGTF